MVGLEILTVDAAGYRDDEKGYLVQKRSLIGDKRWGKRDVRQTEAQQGNWKQIAGNIRKRTADINYVNLGFKEPEELEKRAAIGGGRWRFATTVLRKRLLDRSYGWGKRSSGSVVKLRKRPRPLRMG